jgi:AhpD family alkylhydroperoxidase
VNVQPRVNYKEVAPGAFKAVAALDHYAVKESGLEPRLIHLVKIRASQINGCAYCVDMHIKEARSDGMGQQWIGLICAWRESPVFDARERSVLAWTEALTNLAQSRAPDDDFAPLREHFSDDEIVKLTVAIGAINVWNRLAVGLRSQHRVDPPSRAA